jgi:hypothetical protein
MTREEKARWLAKMYTAIANGETLQYKSATDGMWRDSVRGPDMDCEPQYWRIKPEPRECISSVVAFTFNEVWVKVPSDWPEGTEVIVKEIIE